MSQETQYGTFTTETELYSRRLFDAPRELVFEAWTDPEHLKAWWGPDGFTNTFHIFDLRPGGRWSFVMHGPDGTDYKNESVFVEIVRPERIVLDHVNGPHFRAIATFTEKEGKTELLWRMVFNSPKELDQIKGFAVEGMRQNVVKLEAQVAALALRDAGI